MMQQWLQLLFHTVLESLDPFLAKMISSSFHGV